MAELTSWIVGLLMLALPSNWTQTSTACEQVAVLQGPPGEKTEECRAQWTDGAKELTVVVWQPVVARDGGPMESVEDSKGTLLGKDVLISRTSSFMGSQQEVLVTSLDLEAPKAHVLIYAKGVGAEEFQALLSATSLAKAATP